jgi:hypothetical protein
LPGGIVRLRFSARYVGAASIGILFLFFLYAPAARSFFSSDDWTLLAFYGRQSPGAFDVFFSPKAIWFYRPLQALQFSMLYNMFGLNAAAWGAVQIAMHAVNVLLAGALLYNITKRAALAMCTAMLFGCSWIYVDVLTWKANINTLQWAFTTLAACVVYCGFIDCGCRAKYGLALLLGFVNLFTKESAVALPFLLLVCAWWKDVESAGTVRPIRAWWKKQMLYLAPFAALSLAYVLFHRLFFRNIDPDVQPQYLFAALPRAFSQWMHAINHSLLGWIYDPVLIGRLKPVQRAIVWIVENSVVFPIFLSGLFLFLKMHRTLAALMFTSAALLPTAFLENYHASRYYYLPAMGAATIWTSLLFAAWDFYRLRPAHPPRKLLIAASVIGMFVLLVANIIQVQRMLTKEARAGRELRAGFDVLRNARGEVSQRPLVLLKSPPADTFDHGRGMKYFVRFALDDWDAEAHDQDTKIGKTRFEHLNSFTNRYTLSFESSPPTLQ